MIGNSDPAELTRFGSSNESDREELLGLLQRPLRRSALRHLDSDEGPVTLSELADRIADGDNSRDRGRVVAALHHNHLPRLADFGLVEYDYRRNLVTPRAQTRVEPYLEFFEN